MAFVFSEFSEGDISLIHCGLSVLNFLLSRIALVIFLKSCIAAFYSGVNGTNSF